MTHKPGREYTDDALLAQLAAFLSYRARGGAVAFAAWADGLHIYGSDRDYLECAFMGATVMPGLEVRC